MAKRKKLEFAKKTVDRRFEDKKKEAKLKTMLMYPAGIHDGCSAWRFDWIRASLNYNKVAQVQMTNIVQPLFNYNDKGQKMLSQIYQQASAVVLQRPCMPQQVNRAKQYNAIQEHLRKNGKEPFRFIVDVDDVLHADHISKFNAARKGYEDNKRYEAFAESVRHADELHVCSPTMASFYKENIGVDHVTQSHA